jgi:GT2 family glycosyltransferase
MTISRDRSRRHSVASRSVMSWSVAIVNHGDYDALPGCLASIHSQDLAPLRIRVYDTGLDPARVEEFCADHPSVEFEIGPNIGYASGANRLLRVLGEPESPGFVLIMNADVELDASFAKRLVEAMVERPGAAIGGGKLLRPGRRVLDSAGIEFPRNRRPRDRGSELKDIGQYDRSEEIEGVSGAAMMLRMEAIGAIEIAGECFDEDFFAYHEDTDLCWRARRLGWSVWYEATATAVHRRGWRAAGRIDVPIEVRRHSFKNHYLQIVKNESGRDLIFNLPWLVGWEVLRLGFVLVRDRPLLGGYLDAYRCLGSAYRKRRVLNSKL